MEKVFSLDYEVNDEGNIPHLIDMEAEAKRVFFNWHNNTIERINAIRDENLVESRPMKACAGGTPGTDSSSPVLRLW